MTSNRDILLLPYFFALLSLLFMPSEVMEAVRGQKHYSERTLWHSTQNSVHPTAILEPRPKVLIFRYTYLLEIKPYGLGSRIWDMEAESYNWSHLLVNIWFGLLFISFGKQKRHCGMNQTLSWVPKCALAISFLASNSLDNHGGRK